MVGTRDSCPSSKILARQVLDAKAAGSLQTQEALARAAGVAPSAVSRLRASDRVHTPLAAPQPKTHQILLQLDGDLPALVCTQEGRVDGETAKETNNRCNRNFTRRQAVLRAAGVAAAALATEVSDRVQPLECTNSSPPNSFKNRCYFYCCRNTAQAKRCVVCLTDGANASVDGCSHLFCEGCITTWCHYNEQSTCPTCRAEVREIRDLATSEVLWEFVGPKTAPSICGKAFVQEQRTLKKSATAKAAAGDTSIGLS